MAKNEKVVAAAQAEELLNENFELNADTLDKVAGGKLPDGDTNCPHHSWEFMRKQEGTFWGYNLVYRCRNCGKEDYIWEKSIIEEIFG